MGCGSRNFGKEWIHIDGGNYEHLDYKDITKLEFGDNTVDLIYASHVIQYFDRADIIPILKEWIRVLKPKGILRVAVPDFEVVARLYLLGNEHGNYNLDYFLEPLYGKMEMGDKLIYHKTIYDYKSLRTLLSNIGLSSIHIWDWRQTEHTKFEDYGQIHLPYTNKNSGTLISLNMEGEK